ncbi:MAG TPA: ABC transporter ATP-binding protein [Phycisphaerae bacterium]|nr:ABC transporter ATP-binding protein [Phycisphaerae bacterium]HNU43893.1 ABC transporter ATP-binding protein [Phycisphaerae bacterium]
MDTTPAILCRDLSKRYRQRQQAPVDALRGLDLEVRPEECFGLLGPNGAGKTTTVEILEGILPPTSGTVEVLGRRWGHDDRALRQRLGISLQETRLADKLTAFETLCLFRSFYRDGSDPEEVLATVGLSDKRDSWVVNLSGGQRQRLAVGCALVGQPELLFLDEPTTGLDPQARRSVWEVIRGQRQRGCTIVLTTHYMDEAERLCDRVAVVDEGRVIALGTPAQLIALLGGDHVIEFTLDANGDAPASAADELRRMDGVRGARRTNNTITLTVAEVHAVLPAVLRRLEARGDRLAWLTTRHASLEDVFVNLTGRHLSNDQQEVPTTA